MQTKNFHRIIVSLFACCLIPPALQAGVEEEIGLHTEPNWRDKLSHPDDGCFDLSEMIKHPLGAVPLIIPITEPAVGYGAVGSLVFISENENSPAGKNVKPNIAALGAMATENGSQGYFGVHSGNWLGGKLQTLIALGDISANLDFYGIGSGSRLGALGYEIDSQFLKLEGRYRIGESRSMFGLSYTYGDMETRFKSTNLPPSITFGNKHSKLGGMGVIYNYDSRDNIFTPNKGMMGDLSATFHDPAFGASSTYQKINLTGLYFSPLNESLVFGLRATTEMSFGDVPFYQRPFIQLRGIPAMRYQGEHTLFAEAELRWKIQNRTSLIGFAGTGVTYSDFSHMDWNDHVLAGGIGIRYEIARDVGLHMGLDLGFSEEDTAIYVVFGSAWMRP